MALITEWADCGTAVWEGKEERGGGRGGGEKVGRAVAENIHKNKETTLFPLINYEIMSAQAKDWFLSL